MVSFPQAPLGQKAELDVGGWTDITGYCKQAGTPKVMTTVTRSRQNESTTAAASTAPLTLDNTSGRFTPGNPTGPWYGLLGRNTPLRISIPGSTTALRIEDDNTSSATCPANSFPSGSAGLDLRIDADLRGQVSAGGTGGAPWFGSGGVVLAAQWTAAANQRAWVWVLQNDGTMQLIVSQDGTTSTGVGKSSTQPVPYGRCCLRAVLNATTASWTFYTAPAGGIDTGPWTQLGAVITAAAVTVFASAAPLQAGYCPDATTDYIAAFNTSYLIAGWTGRIYDLEVRNAAGTLAAHPAFSAQAAGTAAWTDAESNPWSLTGSATLDSRSYRAHLECSSLPTEWDPTGHDVWAPVAPSGILRRLQQGNSPVQSTLRRAITSLTGTLTPVAYWPFEDGQGSTQIAPGIPNGLAMNFSGTPGFTGQTGSPSADSTFACSAQLPTMASAVFYGRIAPYTGAGSIVTRFLLDLSTPPADGTALITVFTTGTAPVVNLYYEAAGGGSLRLIGFAGSTTIFDTGYVAFGVTAEPAWVSIELRPSGSSVDYNLVVIPLTGGGNELAGSPSYSGSVGIATRAMPNPVAGCNQVTIGHLSVQADWESMFGLLLPLQAWNGEPAGMRFARLCAENGIQPRIYGAPAVSQAMGPQPIDTLPNLLQYCEDADRGQMFEPRQCLGLAYRTLASMCSRPPSVTLDYSQGEVSPPLKPTYDDQYLRNDITVSRNNGSSYRYQVTSGPASVQPPQQGGAGDYTTSLTVYAEADTQLPPIASWMAGVGTADGERYPQIVADLASRSASMQAVLPPVRDTDIGDTAEVLYPGPELPPGPVTQIAYGMTESLGDYAFKVGFNTGPASPFQVLVLGDPVLGRLDTAGTDLALPVPAPLNANPLFASGAAGSLAGWTAYLGLIGLDDHSTYPGGPQPWSCVYTGTAGGGLVSASFSVLAGNTYGAGAYVYSPAGATVQVGLDWYDGATYLSQSLVSVTVAAGTWTPVASGPQTAPPTATLAYLVVLVSAAPLAIQCAAAWAPGALTLTGDTWTEAAGDFPLQITAGGEVLAVTSIGPAATGARVGVFLNQAALGVSTWAAAQSVWHTWTGDTPTVTRVYLGSSPWSISSDMTAMIAAGVKMCISLNPAYSPLSATDLGRLQTFMAALAAAGAVCDIALWHEPYYSGLSAAQYVAMIKYYGPAVRQYYPLVAVYSGNDAITSYGYYPGDQWLDKIAVDAYCFSGTGQIVNAQAIANAALPPKPFGIWEFNAATDSVDGQSQTAVTTFFTYIQSLMVGRTALGLPNADVILFSAGNPNWLGDGLSAYAGFEGGLGNWSAATNCTVADTSAQAHSGSNSMQVTATASGNALASSCTSSATNVMNHAMPCTAGETIAAFAWFRAATTGRGCQVPIAFYTSAGALISTTFGSSTSDTTSGWVQVSNSATAPATTAYAVVQAEITSAAASEVHYVDDVSIAIIPAPDLTTAIQFSWDYRLALWQAMFSALNNTGPPQAMTAVRAVNGVIKTLPAGTGAGLYPSPVLALS